MRYRRATIAGITIASIGAAVFLYFAFMPSWIYIERNPDNDDEGVVVLTNEDLTRYPILQQNVMKAAETLPGGGFVEKTTFFEGKSISNMLGLHSMILLDRGVFIYDDKRYSIQINYQYDSPIYL